MAQSDIDNLTTGRKAVTGALIAANAGSGAGTDDQTAAEVDVDVTDFGGNLPVTATTVQAALDAVEVAGAQSNGSPYLE